MEETVTFATNDTTAQIQRVIDNLRNWESDLCDKRVKAIILTQLETAQLFSLKLVKEA